LNYNVCQINIAHFYCLW